MWNPKPTQFVAEGIVYISEGKIMLHNKPLPKDCYKVSIQKSLVDAACLPFAISNDCTTVSDALGTFVAWPKKQVVINKEVRVL